MRRLTLLLAALALAVLSSFAVAACGDDDDDGDGGGGEGEALDLVIGNLVPQTGALASFAPAGEKAIGLAVAEVEAAIEEVGADHSITSLTEDTETSPQPGVQSARLLAGEDASCFNGAWASSVTIPVNESVAQREGILQISPASTSPEITDLDDDGLLFRTAPADTFQGQLLADVIEEALGGAEGLTVNIGARNDSYGTGLAETFTESWEAKGGQVGETVVYDIDLPSYNSEAQQIVSGSPDGILMIDFPDPFDKVIAAMERTGEYDPETTFGSDGVADPSLPEIAGDQVTEGMRTTVAGSIEGGPGEAFAELYEGAEGVGRGPYDGQNFDNVILCYLSAVAAGSTDGTEMAAALPEITGAPGDEYTWEELPDAIEALQAGEDINYQGVSGEIEFTETGDPESGVFGVYTFEEGEFTPTDAVDFRFGRGGEVELEGE